MQASTRDMPLELIFSKMLIGFKPNKRIYYFFPSSRFCAAAISSAVGAFCEFIMSTKQSNKYVASCGPGLASG